GANLAKYMRSIIRDDLLFERLFNVVEGGPSPEPKLDSMAWSGVGAQVLVGGDARTDGDNVHLEGRNYEVSGGKILWAKEGVGPKTNSRRLAHLLSDQLTFQLSGQPGIAHTRIAFVNNHSHHKELYVMDYDGFNTQQLTSMHSITLLPKFAPN